MCDLVLVETLLPAEALAADITTIGAGIRMNHHMHSHVALFFEWFSTHRTLIRFLSSVNANVNGEMTFAVEGFAAVGT